MSTTSNIKGYEVQDRIGAGGFGAVYRAYQSTIGREVAIKVILPKFANHPDFIRRFESEAQIVAHLEHMNIVPLYDYWRDPDGAYLVMRFLRGGSLSEGLKSGAFDTVTTAQIMDQIASALTVAHRNGVIHRDIKPSNILLDEDGNAYLTDFGIAKNLLGSGSDTESGDILGSPAYLAPEQARKDPISPRTDIYSLGVVMYELLAGEHPFPNLTNIERMYKHLNEPLPPIKNVSPDVEDVVNDIIQKATAKNPAQRFEDVLAFANAFRQIAAPLDSLNVDHIVESLTEREQEVLRRIVAGQSNRQIADGLVVELSTVKWYIRHIYKKLDVRNRVQAVVRGRQLDFTISNVDHQPADGTTALQLPEPENPYKGLQAFQAVDSHQFFGREHLIGKLVKKLSANGKDEFSRFLAIVGPSGSGKSSVVKAGLIPAVWRKEIPGSDQWFVAEMLPGSRPLDELEISLTRIAANQIANLREHLERDEFGLVRAIQLLLPDDGSEVLLVIDQFEEVFTLLDDEDERVHFLNLLHAAVTEARSRVRVVLTLRADFYDRPLYYPQIGDLVRSRNVTILPLSADELERAIVKPAEQVGVKFEDGLVATISNEVAYQPGALPLLQYALTELFEKRDGCKLTHAAYQEIGGTVGALAKRADELYLELNDNGQEAIRQLFLRLVTLGEGTEDTRRRVARSELLAIATDIDLMDDIIDLYAEYRLLSLDHDPASRTPTVEVAHEAILREWERLRTWLNDSREDVKMQRRLAHAAQEWDEHGQDRSFLLHDARLEQFKDWAASTMLALTQHERAFLKSSVTAEEHRQTQEMQRIAQKEALENRVKRVLQTLVAVFLVAAVIAIGLAVFALGERSTAQLERDKALREANQRATAESVANHAIDDATSELLAAESIFALQQRDTDYALRLALTAYDMNPTSATVRNRLVDVTSVLGTSHLVGHNYQTWFDLSSNGKLLVAVTTEHVAHVIDIETGQVLHQLQLLPDVDDEIRSRPIMHVVDLEGHIAAIGAGMELTDVVLWNIGNGTVIRTLSDDESGPLEVELSADRQIVTAAFGNGDFVSWNVNSGAVINRVHETVYDDAFFAPDARRVATFHDELGKVVMWDLFENQILFETDLTGWIFPSSDGHFAAHYSGGNSDVTVLDAYSGEQIIRFDGPDLQATGAIFLPAPNRLLLPWAAFEDPELWDAAGIRLQTLYGLSDVGYWPRTSDDGSVIAIGDFQANTIRIWYPNEAGSVHVERGMQVWSPDNQKRFDIDLESQEYVLRNVTNGVEVHIEGVEAFPNYSAMQFQFSPNSRYAIAMQLLDTPTAGQGSFFNVYNADSGELLFTHNLQFYWERGFFSSDSSKIIVNVTGQGMVVLDAETGEIIDELQDVGASDYSGVLGGAAGDFANGTKVYSLIAQSADIDVAVWDLTAESVSNPVPISSAIRTTGKGIQSAQLLVDDHLLYVPVTDGDIIRFDLELDDQTKIFDLHSTFAGVMTAHSTLPLMASGDLEGTILLWNRETGEIIHRFSEHTGTIMWLQFTSDGTQLISSSHDNTTRTWNLPPYTSVEELAEWVRNNRYARPLTPDECEHFRLQTGCVQ